MQDALLIALNYLNYCENTKKPAAPQNRLYTNFLILFLFILFIITRDFLRRIRGLENSLNYPKYLIKK